MNPYPLHSFATILCTFLLFLPTFFGSTVYAQQPLHPSFHHEARGAAELQRTDSGVVVSNLGNGPQDRVVIVLGTVPTARLAQHGSSQFIVQIREQIVSLPAGSLLRYELFGGEAGGVPEQQSLLRANATDSGMVNYALDVRASSNIVVYFNDGKSVDFDTGSLAFSVRADNSDTLRERVECGCFQQETSTQQICVWELQWNIPVEIRVSGMDTAYQSSTLRLVGIRSTPLPTYITSLALSTDSIPGIVITGEGVRRRSSSYGDNNIYSAAGDAVLRVDSVNRIAVTGLRNGTRDGLDVWSTKEFFDGVIGVVDMEADLSDPEACIYTTFFRETDTAGYVGFVRDSIGIRFLATMLAPQRSDSSLLDVTWGQHFRAPQNQTLGWIVDTVVVSRIRYAVPPYPSPSWFPHNYQIDFAQPATLRRESKFYTASSCYIEASERIMWSSGAGNVRIRAGAIDTLKIGAVSNIPTGVEERRQREQTEPALQLVQRGDALYMQYGGIQPGHGRLRIIDMAGRIVREMRNLQLWEEEGMLPLDILPLPPGAYLMELDVEGERMFGKCLLGGM